MEIVTAGAPGRGTPTLDNQLGLLMHLSRKDHVLQHLGR